MQVRIYIQSGSKNPRRMMRKYGYVLECTIEDEEVTREGFGKTEATYHGTCVFALEQAMKRLKNNQSDLLIYCEDAWMLTQLKDSLGTWAKQDFLNAKGKPIADQKAWLHVWLMAKGHDIQTAAGRHKYSTWMLQEMGKK